MFGIVRCIKFPSDYFENSARILVPDDIRENLMSRYEYVVAEKEVIPDLTDALRLCETCQDWCPR